MNIAILGAGAWGTALANALASRQSVLLWARDQGQVNAFSSIHQNARYLPGITLDSTLTFTSTLADAVAHARAGLLIIATPIAGLRPVLRERSEERRVGKECVA
jgi:glycerol-3-phosphate dehydrogenase (NAD(P)+)